MSRFLLVIFIIYVHFDVASFQLQYLLLLLYILCSNFVLLCFIEMQFLCGQTKSFSGPKGTVENVALIVSNGNCNAKREGDGKVFLRAAAAAVCKYKFYLFPLN